MKTLKAICTASILALALCVPVSADDTSTPGSTDPGDVHTPGMTTAAPGDISYSDPASTAPGDIGSPGLVDLLWTLVSML
jgi:hypothetical protein